MLKSQLLFQNNYLWRLQDAWKERFWFSPLPFSLILCANEHNTKKMTFSIFLLHSFISISWYLKWFFLYISQSWDVNTLRLLTINVRCLLKCWTHFIHISIHDACLSDINQTRVEWNLLWIRFFTALKSFIFGRLLSFLVRKENVGYVNVMM